MTGSCRTGKAGPGNKAAESERHDGAVVEQVTEYRVCAGPLHDHNARYFTLVVRWQPSRPGLWVVSDGAEPASYVGADGLWNWERNPEPDYDNDPDWRDAYRFDLDTALAIAREKAPLVTVNGGTWADWQQRGM